MSVTAQMREASTTLQHGVGALRVALLSSFSAGFMLLRLQLPHAAWLIILELGQHAKAARCLREPRCLPLGPCQSLPHQTQDHEQLGVSRPHV